MRNIILLADVSYCYAEGLTRGIFVVLDKEPMILRNFSRRYKPAKVDIWFEDCPPHTFKLEM